MKIPSIPQLYRNVKRWREIIAVMRRYGLADWIARLNLDYFKDLFKDREGESLARHTRETRIRMALTDLGPTFIKLGQLLSTRPDLVGAALANELKQLQSDVPADSFEDVRALIEAELGQTLEELFDEFEPAPVASASIGQVHLARLRGGESVVVKVQHKNIENVVREDLDVLAGLAQLATMIPELVPYRPVELVGEMGRTLRRELDFGREERNLQQFASRFESLPYVRIPRPHTELCTARVLTMQRIDGIKIEQRELLIAAGLDLDEIARRVAELYMQMIFVDGFFHADPHPGNLVLQIGNGIGLLDFGMVGRIDERLREDIENMLMAIVSRDVYILTSLIKRIGSVPPNLNEGGLANDVADFVSQYGSQPLDQFDVAAALNDMVEVIHRYQIMLPTQASMLIKTLVTLEGTIKLLTPKFSVMEVMQPFHRKMLLRRLSPARQAKKMRRLYFQLEQVAEELPGRIMDILKQVQAGKFDVHLDHRGLEPSVNRLVLGMLASALFLGSSLMLSNRVPPLLFPNSTWLTALGLNQLSALGLSGCAMSMLIGLRLLRAINKSGHLDRKQ
ncbi:MAG: AarF/ABC1/UbiB kinase family protein [Planctomycetales bacterium]|nr:AarF/ABC1/UbiB kinase family protein [Planctomycetales bacterium]MCA9220600.1 AarF/ABC1/UbiB kinase family protein [Planctomycetales bacterium]